VRFCGWWAIPSASPHARASAILEIPDTEAFISAISGFEISVKHRKGKLHLPLTPREWLAQALAAYRIRELPISLQIAALAPEVDVPHADPCDRMIVATAQLHRIPVMTSDSLISACRGIEVIW
jgi:PIN domain nuclease of toxin-antitoxin system